MSNLGAIAIVVFLGIGMLTVAGVAVVSIINGIQDMKHKKEEWKRNEDAREWGHRR